MRQIKVALYWLTIVPAVIDMIRGAILGVQRGLADIKEKDRLFKELADREAFEKANK